MRGTSVFRAPTAGRRGRATVAFTRRRSGRSPDPFGIPSPFDVPRYLPQMVQLLQLWHQTSRRAGCRSLPHHLPPRILPPQQHKMRLKTLQHRSRFWKGLRPNHRLRKMIPVGLRDTWFKSWMRRTTIARSRGVSELYTLAKMCQISTSFFDSSTATETIRFITSRQTKSRSTA